MAIFSTTAMFLIRSELKPCRFVHSGGRGLAAVIDDGNGVNKKAVRVWRPVLIVLKI